MMEVVLHDYASWRESLLPLVYTRPVGNLRVGVLTLQEKWRLLLGANVTYYTEPYLQLKFQSPTQEQPSSYLVIRANICPDNAFVEALRQLPVGACLQQDDQWLAYHTDRWLATAEEGNLTALSYTEALDILQFPEDIFLKNAKQIHFDYALLIGGRESQPLSNFNVHLGSDLFIAKGAQAECCTFDSRQGPIFIDEGALIEAGSHLKGPIAIGKGARVKMGTRIYPNVTVGPGSTVGGELSNTVLWGNAAKGHDGYLGCAVLGEGCNVGGGTTNSNLQNNWKAVSLYDYKEANYRDTGALKVGFFMGDYAMCGINSSITTGTVIGVGAQVAISNIIPKFVADFMWLTDRKTESYCWDKFAEMMQQRALLSGDSLGETSLEILNTVFLRSKKQREEFIKQ